ncbi:pyridoxamine 5'-phosphate oxidase family protein [Nocardioides sp. W7]|uniref:pyridoxamine 5'-phosphate oxidase family protein n=1 Tax=Nocardioides sp. W7 TaxID=2931390 RepID=UPI001FD40B12|nr:pyridoxamine 5'-phosphate oxidase family protein [Nocardioides sp. W7]
MSAEVELDDDACRALLVRGVVGRLAFWAYDGPRVHPFNYAVLGGLVAIRTRPGSALTRLARERPGALVAFELDQLDHADQRGWSVQARGPVEELTDPALLAEIERVRPPRPWAPGERTVLVGMRWSELTGRQLGTGWDPTDAQAFRRLG